MPIVPQVTTGSFPPSQTSPHDFSLGVGVGAAVGATVGVAGGARVGATVGATVSARVGRAVGGAPAVEPHAARPTAAIAVPMMVVSFMSAAPPLHRPSSWPVQDPSCTPSRTHDWCHTHSTRTRHPLLRTTGFIAPAAQARFSKLRVQRSFFSRRNLAAEAEIPSVFEAFDERADFEPYLDTEAAQHLRRRS